MKTQTALDFLREKAKSVDNLQNTKYVDIEFINEDFTSSYAKSLIEEQRAVGRKKKVKKEEIDRIAATLILQSFLENEL